MREKVTEMLARLPELEAELGQPDVFDDQKQYRLPETVLSLYRPDGKTHFFNGGDEPVTYSWHVVGEEPRKETLQAGDSIEG